MEKEKEEGKKRLRGGEGTRLGVEGDIDLLRLREILNKVEPIGRGAARGPIGGLLADEVPGRPARLVARHEGRVAVDDNAIILVLKGAYEKDISNEKRKKIDNSLRGQKRTKKVEKRVKEEKTCQRRQDASLRPSEATKGNKVCQ